MSKIIILSLFLIFGFTSCKNSEKGIDKLEIAKQYYDVLNNSAHSEIRALLTDSIMTKDDDYEQTFSLKEYAEWLNWDSVFDPTYEILEIELEGGIVKAKISKMDKRISFLHEKPIVTNEIIRFDKNKIKNVERNSIIFNVTTFLKNRDGLVNWIDKNHPHLNGFLHDQTEAGGIKYLKAIDLYKNKK